MKEIYGSPFLGTKGSSYFYSVPCTCQHGDERDFR